MLRMTDHDVASGWYSTGESGTSENWKRVRAWWRGSQLRARRERGAETSSWDYLPPAVDSIPVAIYCTAFLLYYNL